MDICKSVVLIFENLLQEYFGFFLFFPLTTDNKSSAEEFFQKN